MTLRRKFSRQLCEAGVSNNILFGVNNICFPKLFVHTGDGSRALSRDSNTLCCTSWYTICIMHPLGSLVSSEPPNRFPTCFGSFLYNKGRPIIKEVPKHVNLLLLHFLSKFGPFFILVDGFRINRSMFGRLDAVTSVLMKIQFKYSEIWHLINWQIITDIFGGESLYIQSLYSKGCYKTNRILW
jgi:hypothetical protein